MISSILILVILFSQSELAAGTSSNVDDLVDKGNSLASSGQYQEAITYYDKVLAIDPNDVDA